MGLPLAKWNEWINEGGEAQMERGMAAAASA